jgi:hypothetical protein
MTAFDQAWALLKAVEFDPYAKDIKEARPFKAYRSIPTKFLDEVLSEGIQPRSVEPWTERMQRRGLKPETSASKAHVWSPSDKGVWSFMHKRGALPNTKGQQELRESWPYAPVSHPALSARYFADNFSRRAAEIAETPEHIKSKKMLDGVKSSSTMPPQSFWDEYAKLNDNFQHSIVGSTILPPGKRFEDLDWHKGRDYATKPILTTDPIPARYLDEAIPLDFQGNEIRYTQGSRIPDNFRNEWGFNE